MLAMAHAIACIGLFLLPGNPVTEAAFELNFKPQTSGADYQSWGQDDETANFSCNEMSFQSNVNCRYNEAKYSHDDNTPMYQRIFRSTAADETNGKYYWHVIIGDYYDQANNPANTQGFYLEYIIEANSSRRMDDHIGTATSASTDWYDTNTAEDAGGAYVYDTGLNGDFTTSGYGNPTRVIMRQVMEDNETQSEFIKDSFANKPYLSQKINDNKVTDPETHITNEFTVDMRALTYDSYDNTGIIIKNITNISGGLEAANQGNYDTTDATYTPHYFNQEETVVSGGKYTWSAGSGNLGSKGTYTYYNADDTVNTSGFQPTNKNYGGFCDPTYNVNWSGNGACTNEGGDGDGWGRMGWD